MEPLDIISIVGTVASVIGTLYAIFAWQEAKKIKKNMAVEQERQNGSITIKLQHGAEERKLPGILRRRDLTRSEVLGRLGMLPVKDPRQRFTIHYINSEDFIHDINKIAEGNGDDTIKISCNEAEFNQFLPENA